MNMNGIHILTDIVHSEKLELMVVWSLNTNEGIERAQDSKTLVDNTQG